MKRRARDVGREYRKLVRAARRLWQARGHPRCSRREGKNRFAEVTRDIVQKRSRTGARGRLAIVLDGKLYSAPAVEKEINSDSAQISGSLHRSRSDQPREHPQQSLGHATRWSRSSTKSGRRSPADAVVSAENAFIISTALTIGFMLVFYTFGGVVAAIGMGVNVLITLGVMASIGATLTMPGIAGIVLTLAMSVDSNILIFERMREELKLGKSLSTALEAGFDKAWSAILDSNVTTLLRRRDHDLAGHRSGEGLRRHARRSVFSPRCLPRWSSANCCSNA